ncbi:MAG: DUF348 domain-containing protein [Anaerolineales bacterium]|nr:DUF348 domain-containing protein [Anaerolineales bacterium]
MSRIRRWKDKSVVRFVFLLSICSFLILSACADPAAQFSRQPLTVTLTADGETQTLTTSATNVRELLEEAQITLSDTDEVSPPLFTPLTADLSVRIVRVTESIEIIERSIPFERKIVRSDTLGEEDPPRIIQGGQAGLEELTVRIVYRDGLEFERRVTQVNVVTESQDEVVMVGVGVTIPDNVTFGGVLAYISSGNAIIMRGATAFPEPLEIGGDLDRRVFTLSPTGSHLLYTRVPTNTSDSTLFNSLWVISTVRGSQPRPLGVNNVLWADWNPSRTRALEIAYTTAIATDLPPGWEANNDLWLGDVLTDETAAFEPERLVDSYPATYGWWGGNYKWAPNGRYIAYSYADEVGIIDIETIATAQEEGELEEGVQQRQSLKRFVEYDTRADWVWLPSLSWSPDSRYLAYSQHGGETPAEAVFDTWVIDVNSQVDGRFVPQAGIWGYPRWSPEEPASQTSQIAFLRSIDPVDSLRSSYTLWLMDTDGSNARQIYPTAGEISYFSVDEQFMTWNGTGRDMAFVFNDDLYLLNLTTGNSFRITQNETVISHPTWAPYGTAVTADLASPAEGEIPTENLPRGDLLPEG